MFTVTAFLARGIVTAWAETSQKARGAARALSLRDAPKKLPLFNLLPMPHPGGNLPLFIAKRLQINRRRMHAGVTEPALH
jgi:hypothetical protein